jgi:hypothetical protein
MDYASKHVTSECLYTLLYDPMSLMDLYHGMDILLVLCMGMRYRLYMDIFHAVVFPSAHVQSSAF